MNEIWSIISALGTAIGAIATSIAVIIALFQNKKIYNDNIIIKFMPNNYIYHDTLSQFNEKPIIGISICNIGINDLYINMSGISFKRNPHKANDISILFANPISTNYLETIKRGQTQDYIYTYESIKNSLNEKLKEGVIKGNRHIYVFVLTTTKSFWLRTNYTVDKLLA